MKNFGCFLVFVLLLSSTSSFAGDVTLFGGVQREGKISLRSSATTVPSLITFNPKNFGTLGLRLGVGKKLFGTESTLAYSPNFIESNTKALILNQNLVVQAPLPKVRPYLTAGFGTIITKGTGATDIGSKFAINYGGGLKVGIAGPLGVRLDARGYTVPSVQSQSLRVVEVSVGVVFGF